MKAKIFYLDRTTATVGNVVSVSKGRDSITFITRSAKDHVLVESEIEVLSDGILYVEVTENGKFVELIPGVATSFKVVPCGPDYEKATRMQEEFERCQAARARRKEENDKRLRERYAARNKANWENQGKVSK